MNDVFVLSKIADNIEQGLKPFEGLGGMIYANPAVVKACRAGSGALRENGQPVAWRPVSDTGGLKRGHFYLTCNDHYRLCDVALYATDGKWQRYRYADAFPTHWTEWPSLPWEQK